jgi:hypothetical protein
MGHIGHQSQWGLDGEMKIICFRLHSNPSHTATEVSHCSIIISNTRIDCRLLGTEFHLCQRMSCNKIIVVQQTGNCLEVCLV